MGKKASTPNEIKIERSKFKLLLLLMHAADPETTRSCNPSVRWIPPLTAATNGERGLTRDGRWASRTSEEAFGLTVDPFLP